MGEYKDRSREPRSEPVFIGACSSSSNRHARRPRGYNSTFPIPLCEIGERKSFYMHRRNCLSN